METAFQSQEQSILPTYILSVLGSYILSLTFKFRYLSQYETW